eukprot:13650679-Ditylum_brightwellii.AAC.1
MACHSLVVAITVIAEQTRSGTVIVVHIGGGMLVRLVFLIAVFNIFLSLVEGSSYLGINKSI